MTTRRTPASRTFSSAPSASRNRDAGRSGFSTSLAILAVLVAAAELLPAPRAEIVGTARPAGFGMCESATDANGAPRPLCEASDLRFQAQTQASAPESQFGFSIAAGHLNGDDRLDLAVGDPKRNRVYIFFGRVSAQSAYGLMSDALDRGVPIESRADVILERDRTVPGQVGSFGFSVAIGRNRTATGCGNGTASPLLVGAPGDAGTSPLAPGTAFYVPAGALCLTPTDPPVTRVLDPGTIGQSFVSGDPEQNDLFGYSVAFGHLSTPAGSDEDAIVGSPAAFGDMGRVTVFPVQAGVVQRADAGLVRIVGKAEHERLGETLAVGDLDLDFDATRAPLGGVDDMAIGAVGREAGEVVVVQGPLTATGGPSQNGVYMEGTDPRVRAIVGEVTGDYFGFSLAIGAQGHLAVGAIFANNDPPLTGGGGGNEKTNVKTGSRIHAGKVYVWAPDKVFALDPEAHADTADEVIVARRSADQLGFAIAFGDLDLSGKDDLVLTARREDGNGLDANRIDAGTAYVFFDVTLGTSPLDLSLCAANADCTGVSGADVMIFGGDRSDGTGDEIGFAAATGDFNGDGAADLFVSSMTHRRVYAVTLDDSDADRADHGRNIRDDDDDNDGDPDSRDCAPLDAAINSHAAEIPCNNIDENCNGMTDDNPDADGDGYKACGDGQTPADCDDHDPTSHPGAAEVCDGNDNDCNGGVPTDERDSDGDHYVACSPWVDTQHDNTDILGGGDCAALDPKTFPGIATKEVNASACMRDADGDGFGDATPPLGITAGTDCDDRSATAAFTYPGAAAIEGPDRCMKDKDRDGYGDRLPPLGVTAGTDCDDNDAFSYPHAPELCDGNDNACAGSIPDNEKDADGDRYAACSPWNDLQHDNPAILGGGDCDPADRTTFPGAAPKEVVPTACMKDTDHDGYGDIDPPSGVTPGTDCDDASARTFPGAAPLDNALSCMKDADGDKYGDSHAVLPVVAGSDCDDARATVRPGAPEVADDGIDQDCSGADTVTCYVDNDHDGYGGTTPVLSATGNCNASGQSAVKTDCNDNDATVHPGATEIPDDSIDQDCSGFDTVTCYLDNDRDGHGARAGVIVLSNDGRCDAARQQSRTKDDCDDNDPASYPGAPELCDGNDNTCSGSIPANEIDHDGDGYVACAGWNDTQHDNVSIRGGSDCNDTSAFTYPGAARKEPQSSACMKDKDGDGYGDINPPAGVSPGTDCDDESPTAAATFPGAAPLDSALNCMKDVDGDKHGDANIHLPVVPGTDCNDQDPATYRGAPERCDGNDNACSGTIPANERDVDGDHYVACTGWNDTQHDNPDILGGGDCDPADPDTHPFAAMHESVPSACMRDKDHDGFGDLSPPVPGVAAGTDCDDTSPAAASTYPGAAFIEAPFNCMKDADHDGFGDASVSLPIVKGTDCDDTRPDVNRGAAEGPLGSPTCSDGLDNDCDGGIDGSDPGCLTAATPCPDADHDGYADCTTDPTCDRTGKTCGDCNDGSALVHPGAVEVCDHTDNNCNGAVDEGFDNDGDGYSVCATPVPDCNDNNPNVNPGILEVCNKWDPLESTCRHASLSIL